MSCSKSFKICFYGTVLKQFYKLHCNNNFLKEHRSKLLWAFNLIYWRWNLSLGHVYSRDTSILGTPNSVPEKCSHNLCIYYPSIEATPLFRGKGQFFWARKPGFNLHSGGTLALKKWLTKKRVDIFELMYTTHSYESFHKLNYLIWIDAAFVGELLRNLSPTSIQGTLLSQRDTCLGPEGVPWMEISL